MVLTFPHLQVELATLGLSIHLVKCVFWSPWGLDPSMSLPPSFFTPNTCFHILGAQVGSIAFVESFVVEVF